MFDVFQNRRDIDLSKPPYKSAAAFVFYGSMERRVDEPRSFEAVLAGSVLFSGEEVVALHFRYRR
jgi:hypothetical protein